MRGPALSELIDRMRQFDIVGDPADVASLLMELFRGKKGDELDRWLTQLAVDVLHVTQSRKHDAPA